MHVCMGDGRRLCVDPHVSLQKCAPDIREHKKQHLAVLQFFFPRGLSVAKHSLVCFQEFRPGAHTQRLRQFGRLVMATEFHGLAKAFGKFNARRATGNVGFHLLAGVGRKLQVQILGQQRKHFPAFFRALMQLHLILLTCDW